MKLYIASDLHGSFYYTSLMIEDFKKENADYLVLLGDILYHGPRNDLPTDYSPKSVSALLNNFSDRILAVRGNCEAEVDSLMLDFNVVSDYLTIFDGEKVLICSHGHRAVPKMKSGSVYLTGHTHIPHDYVENGVRFINPGSVSIPKENSPHSVCIYENSEFVWKDFMSGNTYSPNE